MQGVNIHITCNSPITAYISCRCCNNIVFNHSSIRADIGDSTTVSAGTAIYSYFAVRVNINRLNIALNIAACLRAICRNMRIKNRVCFCNIGAGSNKSGYTYAFCRNFLSYIIDAINVKADSRFILIPLKYVFADGDIYITVNIRATGICLYRTGRPECRRNAYTIHINALYRISFCLCR